MASFSILSEGYPDEILLKKVIMHCGHDVTWSLMSPKHEIDKRLSKYNEAARRMNWIILRDLDQDAVSASCLSGKLVPEPSQGLIFAVAVRSLEAWALADVETFAKFFRIPKGKLPDNPDMINDPKGYILNFVRAHGNKSLKEDMLPRKGDRRRYGPLYASKLAEYIAQHWRIDLASERSQSFLWLLTRLKMIE